MGLYRRPNSQAWWVRFKVRGTTIRRSTGTADRSAARTRAAQIEAEERGGTGTRHSAALGGGPFLDELATEDLKDARTRGLADITVNTTARHWKAVLYSNALGGARTSAVTKERLTEFVAERRAAGVRGQTIRKELTYLKRAMKRARAPIPEDWPSMRTDPKHATRTGREIPPHLLRAFLLALPLELRDVFGLALMTGMRSEEIYRLSPEWLERAPAGSTVPFYIRLPASGTKTRTERVVGCTEPVAAIIQNAIDAGRSPLFVRSNRRDAIRTAAKAAGLAFKPTLRDCRTTHGSLGAYLTGDAKAVQNALGHNDLKMTNGYMRSTLDRTASVALAVAGAVYPVEGVTPQGAHARQHPAEPEGYVDPNSITLHRRRWICCESCAVSCSEKRHLASENADGVLQGVAHHHDGARKKAG